MYYNPSALVVLLLIILGMGHGCAWYWAQIRGWELTPQLTEYSQVFILFYIVLEYISSHIQKYARKRTAGIEDAEVREKKCGNIEIILFVLWLTITISLGYVILVVVELYRNF